MAKRKCRGQLAISPSHPGANDFIYSESLKLVAESQVFVSEVDALRTSGSLVSTFPNDLFGNSD